MKMDSTMAVPRHLAIIMDGNGRWARSRGLPRVAGHREGAKTVKKIVTHCRKRGVGVLSLYAFSTQNWLRPKTEVDALMRLLAETIRAERSTLLENGVRLTAIGEIHRLPDAVRSALDDLIRDTAHLKDMTLSLALSYGGQDEIVSAARQIAVSVKKGVLSPEDVDIDSFNSMLWSRDLGPIDFLIRTSGENRVSNFMLWSLAYAEFYFTNTYWPDFDEKELEKALKAFNERDRRFGKVT